MTRGSTLAIAAGTAALTLGATSPPASLSQAQAGLWEISGVPGSAAPVRQCVADVALLARFEHRGKNCNGKIVREAGGSSVIEYVCGAAGFGHSEVNVITPRSLRIETQGISDGLPFNYVLQARRVADCGGPPRH